MPNIVKEIIINNTKYGMSDEGEIYFWNDDENYKCWQSPCQDNYGTQLNSNYNLGEMKIFVDHFYETYTDLLFK